MQLSRSQLTLLLGLMNVMRPNETDTTPHILCEWGARYGTISITNEIRENVAYTHTEMF